MSKQTFEMKDYYADIKKPKDAIDNSYPNEEAMQIQLPARLLICAPSGAGKTSVMRNIIDGIGIWDKIVLWAKDLEEPLWKDFIERCQKIEKKYKTTILLAISEGKDLPSVDDWNPKEHNLLLCDDLIAEDPKSLALLKPYWLRGRKKEISMAFLSQGYFDVPKLVRKNCQYLILKKIENPMDLKRILRERALDVTVSQLMAMYKYAIEDSPTAQKHPKLAFFMIDSDTKEKALQFRANFDPISLQ
jgi:hypothetical protein